MSEIDPATAWGLAAALGAGLLIGLERERRKRHRPGAAGAQAAGIRSFALVALAGGLAQVLGQTLAQPALVLLGAALVALLAVVAYARSLHLPAHEGAPLDPGLTTELALFVTYLVGVLSAQTPALGAGAAVVVAVLLAARERLHRFATQALSQSELHDALLLAALALVLLPLAPAALQPWLPVAPRTLLLTVVLILALQGAGHVAGRLLGARAGLALAGLFSGFVSSTATIVAMGSRVRQAPAAATRAAATAGALASTVATWLQVLMLVAALAPAALPGLLPVALAGAAVAAASAGLVWRLAPRADTAVAPPAAAAKDGAEGDRGPLRLREALLVASLLALVSAGVALAQRQLGTLGVLGGTVLAALADAHAPVAALASLQAAGSLPADTLLQGVLLAVTANGITRSLAACTAGGWRYGAVVAGSLALSTASAAALLFGR